MSKENTLEQKEREQPGIHDLNALLKGGASNIIDTGYRGPGRATLYGQRIVGHPPRNPTVTFPGNYPGEIEERKQPSFHDLNALLQGDEFIDEVSEEDIVYLPKKTTPPPLPLYAMAGFKPGEYADLIDGVNNTISETCHIFTSCGFDVPSAGGTTLRFTPGDFGNYDVSISKNGKSYVPLKLIDGKYLI